MRRFIRYILLPAVALIVLLVIAVQIVLWTDLPRQIVLPGVERAIGLRLEAESMSIGWTGHTTLRDVRVALPLADQPFLTAPVVELEHASLPRLLLTGSLHLTGLRVTEPRLIVAQAPDGRWNVQQVAAVLDSVLGGPGPGGGGAGGAALTLPDVSLVDALIEVRPLDREALIIDDIDADAKVAGPLRYEAQLTIADVGRGDARMALAGPYQHEVGLFLEPSAENVGAVLGISPEPARLEGFWRGSFAEGRLNGRLTLRELRLAETVMQGPVELRYDDAAHALTIEPIALMFNAGPFVEPISLQGGQIVYTLGEQAQIDDLRVVYGAVDAIVVGDFDPLQQVGRLTARWRSGPRAIDTDQRGNAELTIARGITGRRLVRLELDSTGRSPWASWTGRVELRAYGNDWTTMVGRVTAPSLSLRRSDKDYRLDGVTARLELSEGSLAMSELRLPDAVAPRRLSGEGHVELATGDWVASGFAESFSLPDVPFKIDELTLEATGDLVRAEFQSISVRARGVQARATGTYHFGDTDRALALKTTIDRAPLHLRTKEEGGAIIDADTIDGTLEVVGELNPLTLMITGDLTVYDVTTQGKPLGDIVMSVRADIDPSQASILAEAPEWLGGHWKLDGNLNRFTERGVLDIDAQQFELRLIRALLEPTVEVEGIGAVDLHVDLVRADLPSFRATGGFTVDDLTVKSLGLHTEATQLTGQLDLDRFGLSIDDMKGSAPGGATLDGKLVFPFDENRPFTASANLRGWPLSAPAVDGRAALDGTVDLAKSEGELLTGSMKLDTELFAGDQDIGRVAIEVNATPAIVDLKSLDGTLLGGQVEGVGTIDLNDLDRSDVMISLTDLEPGRIEHWWSDQSNFEGTFSTTIDVSAAHDVRALAPLEIDFEINATKLTFQGIPFGTGSANAFVDAGSIEDLSVSRVVLQRADLDGAGGRLKLWGRVTPQGGERFFYVNAGADRVDLEILSEVFWPEAKPVIGRVTANLTLSGSTTDTNSIFGHGRFSVTESDFINIPLFRELYNILNLRLGSQAASGVGRGSMRIEGDRVIFPNFRYQNHGAQFTMLNLTIGDFWAGNDSPLSGSVFASISPLPEGLFFGPINDAFIDLQKQITPRRISGTFGDPKTRPMLLRSIRSAFTGVLGQ